MKKILGVLVPAVVAISLVACSPQADDSNDSTTPATEHEHTDGNHAPAEVEPVEEWSPKLAKEAKETASKLATAYARPELEQSAWYAGMQPFLSETAQERYREVSNINITSTAVEKVSEPQEDDSPALCTVSVTTDTATLTLLLSRSKEEWQVEKITSAAR